MKEGETILSFSSTMCVAALTSPKLVITTIMNKKKSEDTWTHLKVQIAIRETSFHKKVSNASLKTSLTAAWTT